jgi:hypothetical protein
MGEVSLHGVFLLLRFALDGVELDSLPLHVCEVHILSVQSVDVGDDTCIPKVEQRIVHHKSVVGRWVEDT